MRTLPAPASTFAAATHSLRLLRPRVLCALPLWLTLSTLAPASAIAALPDLSINDVTVAEGNSGTTTANFTVSLNAPAPVGGVSFDIATVPGSASAGLDFVSRSVTGATIPEGADSYSFAVTVNGDTSVEGDEVFVVHVGNAANANVIKADGTGTITNDDYPAPRAVADAYSVTAGETRSVGAGSGLLANDSDPSGLALQASLKTAPMHGTAVVAANGSFTYTPVGDYVGTDNFVYQACNTASKCSQANVKLTIAISLSSSDQYLWNVPAAANTAQQGFIRLVNRTGGSANVSLWGLDAAGRHSPGSIRLILAPNESRQLNSQDLESGNLDKGLAGAFGQGTGDWTVVARADADVEALAYVRTPDGFLTAMHDRVKGNGVDWWVPVFNPADNANQVSLLRLVNTSSARVDVLITGYDDTGRASASASLPLAAYSAATLASADLENGNALLGLVGKLGDGTGKWRLKVSATGRITVQSLLEDPKGYLTNLSTLPDLTRNAGSEKTVWFVPNAANTQQQGFIRLVNPGKTAGAVTIWGVDDAGVRSAGTITLNLAGNSALQLTSQDLEYGNDAKGITGSLGHGQGNWRLQVLSDLDVWPLSLVRTPDGFLTSVHDKVAGDGLNTVLSMVNPAENANQVSVLRIVNPNSATAYMLMRAVDDEGRPAPAGVITLKLSAGAAIELTSTDLEQGNPAKGLDGNFGDGVGKWRVKLNSDQPVRVVSLLQDPKGYLTNLSTSPTGTSSQLNP